MLVVDASVAVAASSVVGGFVALGEPELVAPALMWSEARSVFHSLLWRRLLLPEDAEAARACLERAPVERLDHEDLPEESWRVADELGWAKTYDAEYVALARLLGCRLVTLDNRLLRGTERLGFVVGPTDL